jgi:3-oxoacyl-[acyl-carrier protein] reductase
VKKNNSEGLVVKADVSREADVEAMAEASFNAFGKVDILANVAGIVTYSEVTKMPLETWQSTFAVHLTGVFLCTRAVLPTMIRNKYGRIINIAGTLAHTGGEGFAHLSAAKAGVIAFSKALAREVGNMGINVNVISPGPIETRLLENVPDEWKQKKFAELPLGKFGDVEDIANAAVFLACFESKYITGQTICVNGGDYMI